MVEGHGRTDTPRKLNARASGAMTGAGALPAAHRQGSRRRLAFGTPGRHRIRRRDETGRYMTQSEAIAASDSNLMALDGV